MSSSASSRRGRLAALSLAALGVVYGDIGTSPLYSLKEVFANTHHPVAITPENVLGILSLVFWSLILVVTIKYVAFMLRADNQGEGGVMSLMALALRNNMSNPWRRKFITMLGLFGAALFYGDGVITPAISVLSAVEGLEVITPGFTPYVVPISIVVIVLLFLIQRHGTASVGKLFGPIMSVWFVALAVLGINSIIGNPAVLRGLSPHYGIAFLLANPKLGFVTLGAVVLVLTGGEALYADMGHFGRKPIQLAWLGFVMPSLVLNYFGQGALLLADVKAIENPFYLLAPTWALYPLVILSTIATVIASQAVISGAFSMTQQAMQLGFSPRLTVLHTSDREIGQVYLPGINWLLLVAVLALIVGFGSSDSLAAAYGIAVTGTMLITNILAIFVTTQIWGWKPLPALLGVFPFIVIDTSFFSANCIKIVDGGWFPLAFGLVVFILLTTWKTGRSLLLARLASDALPLRTFIDGLAYENVTRVSGTAVFFTPNNSIVPHPMLHSLKHYKVLHENILLVTVSVRDEPRVSEEDRIHIERLPENFWRVYVFYGFMDRPNLPEAFALCAKQGIPLDPMETSYFLARESVTTGDGPGLMRWRKKLFVMMFRNAGSASAFFRLPANRVIEMGTQIAL